MSDFLAMSGFMSVFVFMSAANAAPPQPALINRAAAHPHPKPPHPTLQRTHHEKFKIRLECLNGAVPCLKSALLRVARFSGIAVARKPQIATAEPPRIEL